jgi:SAM-dependent methyltransferase
VELRPIDLKAGRHLQVVAYDERQATTTNTAYGDQAGAEVDALLAQPFGNWHVQTTTETLQLRVTKKGLAQLHRTAEAGEQHTEHDRAARHLIDPGDPLFRVLGAGASKRRQVDAFLRVLQAAVAEADLPTGRPLRVVDLGCGNAYLSFAAYRFLAADREVRLTGIDQRPEMRERNSALAAELGWSDAMTFVAGDIIDTPAGEGTDDAGNSVDVVLALHACDTATDDALAQAVRWAAPVVLASPCCHHDLQRQMSAGGAPPPYGLVTRHNILRERLGDVLTDAVRAALLRRVGYQVEVVQFVSAEYTPRNTMIRAVRTGATQPDSRADAEYEALVADWGVTPHLQTLLADDLAARR